MKKELTYQDIKLGSWVKIDGKTFRRKNAIWVKFKSLNKKSFTAVSYNKYGETDTIFMGGTYEIKFLEIGVNKIVKSRNRLGRNQIVVKSFDDGVDTLRKQYNLPSECDWYENEFYNHKREITFTY